MKGHSGMVGYSQGVKLQHAYCLQQFGCSLLKAIVPGAVIESDRKQLPLRENKDDEHAGRHYSSILICAVSPDLEEAKAKNKKPPQSLTRILSSGTFHV